MKQEDFRRQSVQWASGLGQKARPGVLAAALTLLIAIPLLGWGRKVQIRRKFSPGSSISYVTHTETESRVETNPQGLEGFLPPIPTRLVTDQENTMTVRSTQPEGGAEVESRFGRFDIKSELPGNMTEANRTAFIEGEDEFAQSLRGHSLLVRYNRNGQLSDVQGADELLQQVSPSFREPLFQALKYFLGQATGEGIYPDHAVSPGEEWRRKLVPPASGAFPFEEDGTSTIRFTGKTKAGSVEAAVIEYTFSDVLTPRLDQLQSLAPLAALKAQGLRLDTQIAGTGNGRALVALDDGRLLENHATLEQVLTAYLRPEHPTGQPADPITLKLSTDTSLSVAGKDQKN
jgi:hypothetical protein